MYFSSIIIAFMPRLSHQAATDSSFRDNMRLVPMPDSYDLDRGLLLSVQAIQVMGLQEDRRTILLLSKKVASSCTCYSTAKHLFFLVRVLFLVIFRHCWRIKDPLLLSE